MSKLDLDALEKTIERAKAENFDSLAFSMDTVVIDCLIQRLREAEAEIPQLKEQLTFQELDLRNADQRLTEMAQTFGGQANRIERYEARIAQLEAGWTYWGDKGLAKDNQIKRLEERIVQLERVREAAAELKDALTQIGLQMSPDSTTEETVRTGVRTFEATEHYFDRLFDALACVEEPAKT